MVLWNRNLDKSVEWPLEKRRGIFSRLSEAEKLNKIPNDDKFKSQ